MPLDKGKNGFTLPKLPYAEDALAPVISAKTISFHYGKHHKAYVDKLNELIEGTPYAEMSLEDIVKKSAKDDKAKKIFNNAAQAWNHDFYWHSMTPKADAPAGKIKKALEDSFGGLNEFKKAFKTAAVDQFGSGWAWLVSKGGKLAIETTSNADTPIAHGKHAAARRRRVGARLLPRLSESPTGPRPGLARQAARTGRSPRRTSANQRGDLMLGTILLIVLILILIGALPTWPYSSGWGYYPSGGVGLILIIMVVLLLHGTNLTSVSSET